MKQLINKGASRKGFKICLKICIPELSKEKLSEEQLSVIFNYFDLVIYINNRFHRILMEASPRWILSKV